jgi:hypothetical protein
LRNDAASLRAVEIIMVLFVVEGFAGIAAHGGEKCLRVKRDFFRLLCHDRPTPKRPRSEYAVFAHHARFRTRQVSNTAECGPTSSGIAGTIAQFEAWNKKVLKLLAG